MPKWGLTSQQIGSRPWGLPPELLQAEKTITNSIQGDVYLTRLERLVLDSPPVQRLRRVRQLGTTHQVYPDATHVRFSHALGALRSAQDLLDSVLGQQNRPEPQPDLFQEWGLKLDADEATRRTAEAIVLTRLGALLHDLCHVPFGHTIEDDLRLLEPHDENVVRFERFWEQMDQRVLAAIGGDLYAELRTLILSKEKDAQGLPVTRTSLYPFAEDLVGNTICADLLDYLARDHQNLGLPLALGHRFLEGLWVTNSKHPHAPKRVAVEIERHGQQRSDVVSELLKYLRYRYEESERALAHPAKLAADAMVGKLLAMWGDALWVEEADRVLGKLPADRRRDIDELRRWIGSGLTDSRFKAARSRANNPRTPADLIGEIDMAARTQLEDALCTHSDDGLLERVLRESEPSSENDSRREAIAQLCADVLERRLYKRIGRSLPQDRDLADRLWEKYGAPDARRQLEVEAAEFIGLEERWHLVFWLPNPAMKLKMAKVLVGSANWVASLHDHSDRVREIYESHERLWAFTVFAHPELRSNELKRKVLLEWLRKKLGLRGWVEAAQPRTVEELVFDDFAGANKLTEQKKTRLLESVSAMGGGASLNEIQETLQLNLEELTRSRPRPGSARSKRR